MYTVICSVSVNYGRRTLYRYKQAICDASIVGAAHRTSNCFIIHPFIRTKKRKRVRQGKKEME
jgi:hypothetical protein